MNAQSLASLLSIITVQKLTGYLSVKGWRGSQVDSRLIFEKEIEPGETQTIFIPADRLHPKFRSLLQNLMFSLAVSENREPLDIASEIARYQIPDLPETTGNAPREMHEIASHIRSLAQECIASERAKGKLLELARYLLIPMSRSIEMTPAMADELWDTARADATYLPAATAKWLEENTRAMAVTRSV